MTFALGKGEVESSILSCSTIYPNNINAVSRLARPGRCASLRVNDSGTAARNWQAHPTASLVQP